MRLGFGRGCKINPVESLDGEIEVSPDKSISHRAIIMASLAKGQSVIKNMLEAEDCLNTLKTVKKSGIRVRKEKSGDIIINGEGRKGYKKPRSKLYFGNSATGMRLMAGVYCGQDFSTVLSGDTSLKKRPMSRITVPLTRMGANIRAVSGEYPPLKIKSASINSINYNSPIASAQVKSSILFAGLYSDGVTTVSEPYKSRDHTERLFKHFGIPVEVKENTVKVKGGQNWPGKYITVPGDFSSAAFFITAALLFKKSRLIIKNVNINPTRTGFIKVAQRMKGDIKILNKKESCNEPVGDIVVRGSDLRAASISKGEIPSVIDEIPLLALLASRAKGKTIIDGASELRKKETDRLHAISTQLQKLGQSVEEQRESLVITGRRGPLKGGKVSSFKDHRIAMMLTIAGLISRDKVIIDDVRCVDTSFPGFYDILKEVTENG